MPLSILLTILALVDATPIPPAEEETRNIVNVMKYEETGKSWTVEAFVNGTCSATTEVVIHLIQSQTYTHRGTGALFIDDGRFPKPYEDYVGKEEFPIEGVANAIEGQSNLLLKSTIDKPALCPNSERVCKGFQNGTMSVIRLLSYFLSSITRVTLLSSILEGSTKS
jgi:hypothetical protein